MKACVVSMSAIDCYTEACVSPILSLFVYVCLSLCLSMCLSVCVCLSLFVCLSGYLVICVSSYLCDFMSVYVSPSPPYAWRGLSCFLESNDDYLWSFETVEAKRRITGLRFTRTGAVEAFDTFRVTEIVINGCD